MTVVDGEVDAGTATISGAILVRSPGFEDSTGIPGIPDHGVLTGRDEPDQHPASAIDVDGTPLDTVLDNVPLLDAANMFTAKQSIDVQVPVTPIADIATTKPTILARLHGGAGVIVDHFAITLDIGGGVIFKTAGTLAAVVGTDDQPTDEWVATSIGPTGPAILSVTSSDPGELPFIGDLLTSTPKPLVVGTPTDNAHAATKAYVDANGGGGAVDSVNGETGVVVLDAADVGADPAGSAAAAQAAAIAASQPVDSDLTAIAALTTTSYGRAFLALADAAAGRTALGLGTAALSATGDFATAGHNHSGTYQPLDSDLTALAALTTTSFGRALLELADAAAARTAIGAMASTATLPWHDDFTVVHAVRDPLPVTGTYTQSPGALRGGGYTLSQTGPGWVFTYARIPLRAGTYTRRYVARTDSNSGIVTFTIGGISAGTADGYSVGNVNDVVFDATGIVIPSDGFYDLVLTSTTKNASSAGWRANAQLTRLFRTGA